MNKLLVIAIGGNSLIKDQAHQKVEDQYEAVCETAEKIADLIEMGYAVVVTHGNGPQVGFIMQRSEIAEEVAHLHPVPLVSCDADTQGAIGYQIQQALRNEFVKRGLKKRAVTLITQVEVDRQDQAFINPSKPIGQFYTKEAWEAIKDHHKDWLMIEDANRGLRRVVPSPKPKKIIEYKAIRALVKEGFVVIGAGGGGIPVIRTENNRLEGVNAVIDKDLASSLLAIKLSASLLIISTGVDQVCLNYGEYNETPVAKLTVGQARQYLKEGHFAPGSMAPKIQAAIEFVEASGGEAIITSPNNLKEAVKGIKGTRIVKK